MPHHSLLCVGLWNAFLDLVIWRKSLIFPPTTIWGHTASKWWRVYSKASSLTSEFLFIITASWHSPTLKPGYISTNLFPHFKLLPSSCFPFLIFIGITFLISPWYVIYVPGLLLMNVRHYFHTAKELWQWLLYVLGWLLFKIVVITDKVPKDINTLRCILSYKLKSHLLRMSYVL